MSDQGFVDLRLNRDASNLHESFWPSFTDIMTVVVMIFMIASTVLILRNWELMAELRATMEAERAAEERARSVTETKETLEEQLTRAQFLISELRLKLMQLSEAEERNNRRIAEQEQQAIALQNQVEQLQSRLQSSERENSVLSSRLAKAESEYERLAGERQAVQQAYTQLQSYYDEQEQRMQVLLEEVARLERVNREQLGELGELRQARSESQQRLESLRSDYAQLKEKYDELVRPARSAVGKHVAEVHYQKVRGEYRIRLKPPASEQWQPVGREEMHARLRALSERYGTDLYVKIIIPEDSGLSYNEAWRFTRDLLNAYDYYYRE